MVGLQQRASACWGFRNLPAPAAAPPSPQSPPHTHTPSLPAGIWTELRRVALRERGHGPIGAPCHRMLCGVGQVEIRILRGWRHCNRGVATAPGPSCRCRRRRPRGSQQPAELLPGRTSDLIGVACSPRGCPHPRPVTSPHRIYGLYMALSLELLVEFTGFIS